jgi:hypothetical protein
VQPNHEWTANLSQVKPSFDPTLIGNLQTVLTSAGNKKEPIIDFDPFDNVQWDASAYACRRYPAAPTRPDVQPTGFPGEAIGK